MANNEFLVSVANVILRNPTTFAGIAYGKANISSAFTISMQKTEVRGGINNPLLYTYFHDRMVEIKIEQAIFTEAIVALNAGASILSQSVSVLKTECLVLSASGSQTLAETPTGNVNVFLPNGTIQDVTPTVKAISVSGGADQKVDVVYAYNKVADQIIVDALTPPTVVDATLIAEVRDNTGVITYYLQINIPRFQISGNYTMSLAANGVSTQALEGNSLVTSSADCTSGDYYAKVTWVAAGTTTIPVTDIAATPSLYTFITTPETTQLTVLGIRGGIYTNLNITTSCSFVKTGSAFITAGLHTGLITAASSASSGHSATIAITYFDATSGSLSDSVSIAVA